MEEITIKLNGKEDLLEIFQLIAFKQIHSMVVDEKLKDLADRLSKQYVDLGFELK